MKLTNRRRPQREDREDGWETVMVQITFGFVIILGYLLSDGNRQVEALDAEVTELQQQIAEEDQRSRPWREAYQEIMHTSQAALVHERDDTRAQLQLERLLRAWDQVRDLRRFRQALVLTRDGLVPLELSDDASALPVGEPFDTLQADSRQLFATAAGSVEDAAIERFIEQIFQYVEIHRRPDEPALRRHLPTELDQPGFDPAVVTADNLETLEDVIRENLLEERSWLVDVQLRLVRDCMNGRIDWLARHWEEIPVEQQHEAQSAQQQLRAIADDLHQHLHLLDETRLAITDIGSTSDE